MSDFNQRNSMNYSLPDQIGAMQSFKDENRGVFKEKVNPFSENNFTLQSGKQPLPEAKKTLREEKGKLGENNPSSEKTEVSEVTYQDTNQASTPNIQNKFKGNFTKAGDYNSKFIINNLNPNAQEKR